MSRFQALRASWVSCFGSVDSPTSARKCEVRSSAFSSSGLPTGPGAPNVHPARRHTPPPMKLARANKVGLCGLAFKGSRVLTAPPGVWSNMGAGATQSGT